VLTLYTQYVNINLSYFVEMALTESGLMIRIGSIDELPQRTPVRLETLAETPESTPPSEELLKRVDQALRTPQSSD
jgi:hypothetical protein